MTIKMLWRSFFWTALLSSALFGQAPKTSANATWAVRFADSIMTRWPDPVTLTNKGWEYNNGIILHGMRKVYEKTGDRRYLDYIQRWVDHYVDDEGNIQWREDHNLDVIQPATLLLLLFEETSLPKYQASARKVRERFDRFPKNAEGGFWHKEIYPNEMWVDGVYMAEPFLVAYGKKFQDNPYCSDTAVFQTTLAGRHTLNRRVGLLYHGWDADRNAAWADPKTGLSSFFWSRGVGWYAMALVDILEYLPEKHPGHPRLRELLRRVADGLGRTQDPKTGLWHQVMDQGGRSDNWIETSGSGMFIYALKTAADRKLLPQRFERVAARGWQGLQAFLETDQAGLAVVTGAVEGMGVQKDYAGYVGKRRLSNSSHGLCAVQLAASAMEFPAGSRREKQ
jgi:unsaturated rhamnogalacturonyl hydrolase